MRAAHPSAWFQKSIKKSQTPERHHPDPPPPAHTASSAFNPFHHLTLRNKDTQRPSSSSTVSVRSAYITKTEPHTSTLTLHAHSQDLHHPFATMAHAPLPVVSSHDSSEEEEECPVCLEPLSFSFRLPGEKPHIVPECGHSLHQESRPH
ncbi:hypothetical protein BC827DRAFT_806897 [Russula dissimulans]|nr:hypothetical protein BC827DRAFT_806897 [Russula dissimulans]